jgi:hypothetical protein
MKSLVNHSGRKRLRRCDRGREIFKKSNKNNKSIVTKQKGPTRNEQKKIKETK